MKGFATPVSISSGLSVDEAVRSLRSSFDKPLSEKDPWGIVEDWTVFGDVRGTEVKAETAGSFGGWSARNGMGVWQPVFRGRVQATASGSVLRGQVSLRRSFRLVIGFLLVWAFSLLVGLVPQIARDITNNDVAGALGLILAILLMVGVPTVGIAFVWRKGLQEAHALRARFEAAFAADPRAA